MTSWKGSYQLRVRESDQIKTVLELYEMEIHHKISKVHYQKKKSMVKRRIDQKLRLRNFDARNERIETGARVTSRMARKGVARGRGECWQWKAKGQCSRRDKCSFRHDEDTRAKPTPKTAPPSEPPTQRGRQKCVEEKSLRGRSPSVKFARQPCKNFLKGICTKSPFDYWHPPDCQLFQSETGCKFGDKCSFAHKQVEGQPSKKPKKDGDKNAVAIMPDVRQLGCVFQDIEPSESLSILRKGTKILGPIRRVRFSTATLRHANIRENKGQSLGKIQVKVLHQRSPYAMKFEDSSQEEIERQERCARGDAWRLAKNIFKLKETDKATFFSPTNEWCLPAPYVIKQEEREIVVVSGASMHILSRKDLNSAELETVRVSKSPTTFVAVNREVLTKEEANSECQRIGFIRDSQASRRYTSCPLTRKTLRRSWVFLPLDKWSETTTHQRWENNVPIVIDELFRLSYTYISNISIARSSASRMNRK